jgi:hypothetical protein
MLLGKRRTYLLGIAVVPKVLATETRKLLP